MPALPRKYRTSVRIRDMFIHLPEFCLRHISQDTLGRRDVGTAKVFVSYTTVCRCNTALRRRVLVKALMTPLTSVKLDTNAKRVYEFCRITMLKQDCVTVFFSSLRRTPIRDVCKTSIWNSVALKHDRSAANAGRPCNKYRQNK